MTDILKSRSGYLVGSLSHPGYWVLVDGASCSCPAGQRGALSCRHRRAVQEKVRAEDLAAKRPVAPPAVALLVDEPPYRPDAA